MTTFIKYHLVDINYFNTLLSSTGQLLMAIHPLIMKKQESTQKFLRQNWKLNHFATKSWILIMKNYGQNGKNGGKAF